MTMSAFKLLLAALVLSTQTLGVDGYYYWYYCYYCYYGFYYGKFCDCVYLFLLSECVVLP